MNKCEEEKKKTLHKLSNQKQKEDISTFLFICFDYRHISITENKIFTVCKKRKKKEARLYTLDREKR